MSRKLKIMGTLLMTFSTILLAGIFPATRQADPGAAQELTPSLSGATGWLNTKPLTLTDLRGKVVLIEFWTYTCINWRRTLPYVRDWAAKYKDQGLVVIGVHAPEFPFEHRLDNIGWAIKEMNIAYPVAVDNNFEIWRSFQNQYWPALYLIDAKGQLRYQKFGEGDYQKSELQIQRLLKEASAISVPGKTAVLQPEGFEAAADWGNLQSSENYVGYSRTDGFASPEQFIADNQVLYTQPKRLTVNQWGLSGKWTMGKGSIFLNGENGKIIYGFHARDLNLIMGAAVRGNSIKFRVLINGLPPGAAHGLDVDSDGYGTVSVPRMYQLIRQQRPITEKDFQIEFLEPNAEVFDFTFG